MPDPRIKPYEDKDFIRDAKGRIEKYAGQKTGRGLSGGWQALLKNRVEWEQNQEILKSGQACGLGIEWEDNSKS